jgi:hypothetical protein
LPAALTIGAEVIAAEHAVKFLAQNLQKNVRAPRRRNLEEGEKRRPEAPGPIAVAIVVVARLVDVDLRLFGQEGQQFFIRNLQTVADLGTEFGQIATTDTNLDYVAQELAYGREGRACQELMGFLRFLQALV